MKQNPEARRLGLARALSKLGYCSRSQASVLIREGRVQLNGTTRRDPETPVQPHRDRIEIDGLPIGAATKTYLMLNKPRGVVTTASDEKDRVTIYSYLDGSLPWLAPVGRLDKASEGLLLITNDSEWAARITAPESHVEKTYHVQLDALADQGIVKQLTAGVCVGGDFLRAKHAKLLRSGTRTCWLEIILDEGKNRQIRRMIAHFEIEILRLVRVAIGPLQLGDLAKGTSRPLHDKEKQALDAALRRTRPNSRG